MKSIEMLEQTRFTKLTARWLSKDNIIGDDDRVDQILGCREQKEKGQFLDSIQEVDADTECPKEHLQGSGDGSDDINGMELDKRNVEPGTEIPFCSTEDNPSVNLEECTAEGASNSNAADELIKCYEFLVKWVGKSHIHNAWIPQSQLKELAKRKLDKYLATYGFAKINLCQEKWKKPHRVISLHSFSDGLITDVFVKWTDLPYDECSWEKIDVPVITKSFHLIDLCKRFEHEALEKDKTKDRVVKCQGEIVTLCDQPEELEGGQLFPHQLEAFNWLRNGWYKSKNAILADEMGLGKTVSVCAFISSLYYEFKATLPCLVLVPLSKMPNWMAEFAAWAPNLNVVEYHGSTIARSIIRQYEWQGGDLSQVIRRKTSSYKFNVLLTTYEMVLADSAHLRGIPWEVLVLDVGHRLKDSGCQSFGILNDFSFQHRVMMTGTSLQNNIEDLFHLLHFLERGLFPSLSSFEDKFNDLTNAEKLEELKRLVAPLMLRRLKNDVMISLPPITERLVPVELSSNQTEIYRAMLTKNYQVLRNIRNGVAHQSVLNIVVHLRNVCNHPYLIPGTEPESGSLKFLHEMRIKVSAKLTLLHSMLRMLLKEGHRVLIFSQMTKLLDILEDYLTIEFGPKTYERVDGSLSIADRQAAIKRFNQDKSRFVFLLSTQSCGLGINLATADTVIIYDSDINPHADIQAMNRAHRIGQSNQLLVYRLIVRASVEESILQHAKKQLFVSKSGWRKELDDILKWGTEEVFREISSPTEKVDDQSTGQKDDGFPGMEHKRKRRTFGGVYKDTCVDGNNKIVWSETDIIKLLDRSNTAEMESENGLLGCVKTVEWNDDTPIKEESAAASTPITIGTKTEDRVIESTVENDWDRLLRVRWKNLQDKEKEGIGRGKRQRKPVTYNDFCVPYAAGTVSEERLALRSSDKSGKQKGILAQPAEEKTCANVFNVKRYAQTTDGSSINIDLGLKLGRTSNDTPLRSLVQQLPSRNVPLSFTNSLPSDYLTLASQGSCSKSNDKRNQMGSCSKSNDMRNQMRSCSKSNDRRNQMGSCSDPSKESKQELKMLKGLRTPLPCENLRSLILSSFEMLGRTLNRSTLSNTTPRVQSFSPETRFGSTVLSPDSLVNRLNSIQDAFNQAYQDNSNQIPPFFLHSWNANHQEKAD